ncbi:caspase family protein [Methylobacterium nodulans]|uniref:Peptidase C14 caspase catalytic subunit p20 n=1 Tax=Methylobacterium nodulans (strain LMG 21967 / CNCM I-2342 / ORS 2060) TaxID=460265 RepID=B8ILI2_METNO|nr:caspase family protein [Methylobacterium nodulans]ACL60181.1 peptidase C14 caspase catalytic subunit p20 [Methylobacterium nodulans ORS 2060]
MQRWILAPVLVLAGFLVITTNGVAAERRVALVIGNSAYRSVPVLANPGRDAAAVAEMLRRAGFDSVELRQDLGTVELKRATREFMQTAREADIALVYFAGHGIEVSGINYLIPTDARLKSDFDVEDEGLSLERVVRAIEPARRLRLVILDACRNNPFNAAMQRMVSVRAVANGLAKVEPAVSDTLVAFAARAGSVAEDGAGEHSPFTTALLKHLPVPGLDVRVAFGRVRDEVLRLTGGKQEPFVYGSLGGAITALVPDDKTLDPGGAERAQRETRRDYEFAERVGTREAWSSFLAAHPTGFYADLARAQVAKLTGSTGTAAVPPPPPPLPERKPLPQTRPIPHDPATAAVAPGPAAQPPGAGRAGACQRDAETLARLRARRVPDEILRFQRELVCDELRPQVARLIESMEPPDGPARPKLVPDPVPPQPFREPDPASPALARATPSASSCEQEAQTLATLRNTRDKRAIDRFARDLTCQDLRPQVMRLRESVDDE